MAGLSKWPGICSCRVESFADCELHALAIDDALTASGVLNSWKASMVPREAALVKS